ncbi:MAG: sigma-70 family RNA polymerase sigma factor [Candidatus Kapabacteria bacterium]|jgi:RNA polymerase sigma-70 factor (ECF subfamily)|nr:sigma-70 family RNA polymerase sigma factor [Candidatus Kapabacteria bacterium]
MSNKKFSEDISDEDLFFLVQKGDRLAFDTLYSRFSKRLYAYCLKACSTKEIAQDTFQGILTIVLEKKESFIGGNFTAWIMTIARNQCLLLHRNRKNVDENVILEEELVYTRNDSDFGLKELLVNCVNKLPEEFAEIINLRYYSDFNNQEIAETLKISEELVRVRLFRAKKMLTEIIKPYKDELR